MGRSLQSPETVKEEGVEGNEDNEAADRARYQGWDQDALSSPAWCSPLPQHTSVTIP